MFIESPLMLSDFDLCSGLHILMYFVSFTLRSTWMKLETLSYNSLYAEKNVSYLKGGMGLSAVVLHISSFSTEIEEGIALLVLLNSKCARTLSKENWALCMWLTHLKINVKVRNKKAGCLFVFIKTFIYQALLKSVIEIIL